MACRVGMSTNPQERMEYWARVEGHSHSQILAVGLTYDEAHVRERAEAQARGCKRHHLRRLGPGAKPLGRDDERRAGVAERGRSPGPRQTGDEAMACRVGMSTNPQERMEYWAQMEGHSHSQILAVGLTYDEAHVLRGGGPGQRMHAIWWWAESLGAVWSVYIVWS